MSMTRNTMVALLMNICERFTYVYCLLLIVVSLKHKIVKKNGIINKSRYRIEVGISTCIYNLYHTRKGKRLNIVYLITMKIPCENANVFFYRRRTMLAKVARKCWGAFVVLCFIGICDAIT